MPRSPLKEPPYIEDFDMRQWILDIHNNVYGLGTDATGDLDDDNLSAEIPNRTTIESIIAKWTFSVNPSLAGTTNNVFTLDSDDTGGNVDLVFGTTADTHLRHTATLFELNDDLSLTDNDITNVGDIALDSITPDDATTVAFNIPVIDLSTQTVDVTLNSAVDALNFSSNTLSIDTTNTRVGINTAAPAELLDINGNIKVVGTTTLNTIAYTWPSADATASGYALTSDSAGTLSWADVSGSTAWTLASNIIYPSTLTDKLGIGTITVPHGTVGFARVQIEGADASGAGPHMQFTTASDDYPLIQIRPWAHDNIVTAYDAYFDGAWKSSDAGTNFAIEKGSDKFNFLFNSGTAQGSSFNWSTAMQIDSAGDTHFLGNEVYVGTNDDLKLGGARIDANYGTNQSLTFNAKGNEALYLNYHSGSGGVKICAGSSTEVFTVNSSGNVQCDGEIQIGGNLDHDGSGAGFYGTVPVTQRLKADYGNWAALNNVVDALVALGLFDQA